MGIMCQQGFIEEFYKISTRFALFVFILFSTTIYQFYSSFIVGSLLTDPPKTINNLRQLIDSNMRVGIEDVIYNRDFLETTTDKLAIELYQKRIINKSPKGNYLSVDDGINQLQKGNFAFQVDTSYAYRLIKEKFTDDEICELHEVLLFPKRPLCMTTAKHSPFREMFRIQFLRFIENGIISYHNSKWQEKKQKCVKSITKIKAVDIESVSWIFMLLVTMIVISFIVVAFENFHHICVMKAAKEKKKQKRGKVILVKALKSS
jgi:hypothetical protein